MRVYTSLGCLVLPRLQGSLAWSWLRLLGRLSVVAVVVRALLGVTCWCGAGCVGGGRCDVRVGSVGAAVAGGT